MDAFPGAPAEVDHEGHDHRGQKWRTLGTGLPGYRAGWFRLRNGEKALRRHAGVR